MKRILFTLAVLASAFAATADSYFTAGVNDTVFIDASSVGGTVTLPIGCHFDKRVGHWHLELTYPEGMTVADAAEGEDMTVPYLNSEGTESLYNAVLTFNASKTIFSSMIRVYGYWPNGNGSYYCYGTATWPSGNYDDMFRLTLAVPEGFTGGHVTIDGRLTGSAPGNTGIGGVLFYRTVTVVVSGLAGDVDGDGTVGMDDLTALINYLVFDDATGINMANADADANGTVGMDDLTALINYLVFKQWP